MYQDNKQFDTLVYHDPTKIRTAMEYYTNCFARLLIVLGRTKGVRFLEVGSGLAWMCRAAKQYESKVFTIAQDITAECVEECVWVDKYIVGSIEDSHIDENAPYDIISLTHVIEHLPNPITTLNRLRQVLNQDGCILVTAPHRPEVWDGTRFSWGSWSYHHVPLHLQYFSRVGFETAAKGAGLSVSSWELHENGQAFEAILQPAH